MIVRAAAAAAALAFLASCGKQNPEPGRERMPAIGFGDASVAEAGAAETKAGEKSFGRDFVVCAIKDVESGKQFVFPGFNVRYQNPGYSYIFGDQTVKYWDTDASGYAFWGFAPAGKADVSLSDMDALSVGLAPGEALQFHYSEVEDVRPSAFGREVQLKFARLGSRVRFGFYETLAKMGVKELEFSVGGNFYGSARYLMSARGLSVHSSTASHSIAVPLLPGPVQADRTQLAEGRDMTSWIPVLPLTDSGLTITIESCVFTQDGSSRTIHLVDPITVPVPQEYCWWGTNRDYTYIFQISSVKEDFDQIIFSFDRQIVRDWEDNGAEGIYDFQPE